MEPSVLDKIIADKPRNGPETELTPLGDTLDVRCLLARIAPKMTPEGRQNLLDADGNPIRRSNGESVKRQVALHNRSSGNMNERGDYRKLGVYYDCPKCRNRGNFAFVGGDGLAHYETCVCMAKRESLRYIQISGLSELLTRYRADNWQCREPWQRKLMESVRRYAEAPEGWFVLTGASGTGKTHLCTVLCNLLMERGYYTRYLLWRDFSQKAKALVNDTDAYDELVEPFVNAHVLYIDDFFKTGRKFNPATGKRDAMAPTEADINLAFKIINGRYNHSKLLTVISSEMSLGEIANVDEATGSRIAERARNWYANLRDDKDTRNPKFRNWRLCGEQPR